MRATRKPAAKAPARRTPPTRRGTASSAAGSPPPEEALSDLQSHAVVRGAFLEALQDDERVVAFFNASVEKLPEDLRTQMMSLASCCEMVTRVSRRSRPRTSVAPGLRRRRPADRLGLRNIARALEEERQHLSSDIDRHTAPLFGSFVELVHELRCPWPWLAVDLFATFRRGLNDFVAGARPSLVFSTSTAPPRLVHRQFSVSLASRPGESVESVKARLRQMTTESVRELDRWAARHLRPARRPRNGGGHLERDARWFYRHHVLKETPGRIAAAERSRRPAVELAIQRARELLSRGHAVGQSG